MEVSKEFTFDCAHMLTGHDGLCKNLHGHTYKLIITLEGVLQDRGSSKGMVMDFSHLKKVVNDLIVSRFDHAFIYDATGSATTAESSIAKVCDTWGMRTVPFDGRVTAENMAMHFFEILSDELNTQDVNVSRVRVYETPTSYAEVSL